MAAIAQLRALRRGYQHDMYVRVMWSFRSSWQLFPRWLKVLTIFLGLPAWLGFAGMIVTGSTFEHETATLMLFGVFAFVAVCQIAFTAMATWRNDL